MMDGDELREMIEYYRAQGAPQDQQMLIALLREAQEMLSGALDYDTLEAIAAQYGMKSAVLRVLIARVPDLKTQDVRHRLEVCGSCRAGAGLRSFIERTYGVKSGGMNREAGFAYRVTPCMKNCKNGPSVKWDGKLYGHADETLIRSLIEK